MKEKIRLPFLIVVVIIVLSISSTALADSYNVSFLSTKIMDNITGYMGVNGVVADLNTRFYYQSGSGNINTAYTSRGYYKVVGSSVWYSYAPKLINSGRNAYHYYNDVAPASGKLGFYNSQQPGYQCVANGNVYITSR